MGISGGQGILNPSMGAKVAVCHTESLHGTCVSVCVGEPVIGLVCLGDIREVPGVKIPSAPVTSVP